MPAWVEIEPLQERAIKMPGAVTILERAAKDIMALRVPKVSDVRLAGESGDNMRNVLYALINADYIKAEYDGGAGGISNLSLTDAGWKALGQPKPMWL